MQCENCGGPVDLKDVERGTCAHCGAALAYVLRAAEKAEIVRRVVAQGGTVRIDGDRIEASSGPAETGRTPNAQARANARNVWVTMGISASAILMAVVASIVARSSSAPHLATTDPPPDSPIRSVESAKLAADQALSAARRATEEAEKHVEAEIEKARAEEEKARGQNTAHAARPPGTVAGVVESHKAQYQRCERDEIGRNPSAPRRYSVAITVNPQGAAEWVEVLSEVSPQMKSCIESVTRGLIFTKPSEGSVRSIVTLSLAERT
jgi:hypothetical protein